MNIIFQDEYIIAVNKPPFLLVHKSSECTDKDNLLKQVRNKINQYVYPLHRLDRAVSGIVVFSKSPHLVKEFQTIWHTDKVRKFYLALSKGNFTQSGEFNFALKAENNTFKEALTRYRPLVRFQTSTLLEVEIKTGRHHQIRRHFARRVEHLLGDRKYGKKKYNDYYLNHFDLKRIFLHSHKMELENPINFEKYILRAPLADDLSQTLSKMKIEYLETLNNSDYIESYE